MFQMPSAAKRCALRQREQASDLRFAICDLQFHSALKFKKSVTSDIKTIANRKSQEFHNSSRFHERTSHICKSVACRAEP